MRWSVGGSTANAYNHYSEIQVWTTSGVNLVTSSTVVTVTTASVCMTSQPIENVKDGDTSTFVDFNTPGQPTAAVQVDLGSVRTNVRSIKFWNYWQNSRTYYNVQLTVSVDGLRWVKVYGPVDTLQTSSGTEVVLSAISTSLPYFILPQSYSYDIQPSVGGIVGTGFPDPGNLKLTDGIIAGHFYYGSDSSLYWLQWVGWHVSSPVITFNFAKVVTISKVSIYFQGDRSGGIYLPATVTITGTTSKTFTVGDLGINGWQDFAGLWIGSTITVKLTSSGDFTFVSEVVFTELKRFEGCSNLTSITIPTTVTTIGNIIILLVLLLLHNLFTITITITITRRQCI